MIESFFSNSLDGWIVDNGTQTLDATVGNPSGSLRATEAGDGIYDFVAPAKFLGDMADYIGGALAFDLKQDSLANQYNDRDLELFGGGLTLVADVGPNPGTTWTSYTVELGLAGGFKIDSLTGRVATTAEIETVLSDLDSLKIRGEFVSGTVDNASNLDNVIMSMAEIPPIVIPGPIVQSTFNSDIDGWSFAGDVQAFGWQGSGGNKGGWLEAVDTSADDTWYFVAPDEFLGDKAGFYDGEISFELKQSTLANQFDDEDVIMEGGGKRLVLDLTGNPGLAFTQFSVSLNEAPNWRLGRLDGPAATEADIRAVLSDMTGLQIRGEYVDGDDAGGLDNVVLEAPEGALIGTLTRYDTESDRNALSTHATLRQGLDAAVEGNAIGPLGSAYALQARYQVGVDDLTLISDASLDITFTLDGVRDLTLLGANTMNSVGNEFSNRLVGSDGANTLRGKEGDDRLFGHAGNDTLFGARDNDRLDGGRGNDSLSGGKGNDVVDGGSGDDIIAGNTGTDVLSGGLGDDILRGGIGQDMLLGGGGADTLKGGAGSDFLDGAAGNDVLVFKGTFGRDTVQFEDGSDVLRMVPGNGEARTLAEFKAAAEDLGEMVVYDLGGDGLNVITLLGASLSDLTTDDFVFV